MHSWVLNGRRVNNLIRSIHSGTTRILSGASYQTTTLSSNIDPAHSVVIPMGATTNSATGYTGDATPFVSTLTATYVEVNRGLVSSDCYIDYSWMIIEFWPGVLRSCGTGYIALSGTSSGQSIPIVDPSRTVVMSTGNGLNVSGDYAMGYLMHSLALSYNGIHSQITATRVLSTGTSYAGYAYFEFA